MLPKGIRFQPLKPVNMSLYGQDVKVLRWGEYPGSSRWALNAITSVLIKKEVDSRQKQCDNGGTDSKGNDVTLSQALLAVTKS